MKGLGLCQAARKKTSISYWVITHHMSAGSDPLPPPSPALPKAATAGDEQPHSQESLLTGETQPCDARDGLTAEPFLLQSAACRPPILGLWCPKAPTRAAASAGVWSCWGSISPARHQVRAAGTVLEEHSAKQDHDVWDPHPTLNVPSMALQGQDSTHRLKPLCRRQLKGDAVLTPPLLAESSWDCKQSKKARGTSRGRQQCMRHTGTCTLVPTGHCGSICGPTANPHFCSIPCSTGCCTQVCGLGGSDSSWDLV